MAAPIKPQKKQARRRDTWWLVPAIADQDAPTVAEVNAVTGLNITCFLLADQEGLTATTEKVTLAQLLCDSGTTESIGDTTWSMADMQGVYDPQGAPSSAGVKFWELIEDGFVGYAVQRQGVDSTSEANVVAGEYVHSVAIEMAPPTPGKTSTGADGIYSFTAAVGITGNPKFRKAVVA